MPTDAILWGIRLLLTGTFLLSSVTKWADVTGTQQAIRDFGIPPFLARPIAFLLPLIEIGIAAALLTAQWAWWGAVVAFVLVLLFIGAISLNMLRGNRPDCHCFGQLHSEPIGASTLARNGLLLILTAVLLWSGDPALASQGGILSILARLLQSQIRLLGFAIVIFGLLIVEGWMILHLFKQQGRLLLRIDELEKLQIGRMPSNTTTMPTGAQSPAATMLRPGLPAPSFTLPDLHNKETSLEGLLAHNKPLLLLFADPGCGPCRALLPEVKEWQDTLASNLIIVIISRGKQEDNMLEANAHGLQHVLLQKDYEIGDLYGVYGTPSAVFVRPDGTLGSTPAGGRDAIRGLVATASQIATTEPPHAAPIMSSPDRPVIPITSILDGKAVQSAPKE